MNQKNLKQGLLAVSTAAALAFVGETAWLVKKYINPNYPEHLEGIVVEEDKTELMKPDQSPMYEKNAYVQRLVALPKYELKVKTSLGTYTLTAESNSTFTYPYEPKIFVEKECVDDLRSLATKVKEGTHIQFRCRPPLNWHTTGLKAIIDRIRGAYPEDGYYRFTERREYSDKDINIKQ